MIYYEKCFLLECPAKTESGFAVGLEADFCLLVSFFAFHILYKVAIVIIAGAAGVVAGLAGSIEAEAEFSTYIQAFVNIEVNAGENVNAEDVGGAVIVVNTEIVAIKSAPCVVHLVFVILIVIFSVDCRAGIDALVAETCAYIDVKTAFLNEVTLVAEVDGEIA